VEPRRVSGSAQAGGRHEQAARARFSKMLEGYTIRVRIRGKAVRMVRRHTDRVGGYSNTVHRAYAGQKCSGVPQTGMMSGRRRMSGMGRRCPPTRM